MAFRARLFFKVDEKRKKDRERRREREETRNKFYCHGSLHRCTRSRFLMEGEKGGQQGDDRGSSLKPLIAPRTVLKFKCLPATSPEQVSSRSHR